jgi:transcriptional regulator with XRE-family HTH domain
MRVISSGNSPVQGRSEPPPLPIPGVRALKKLGQDLKRARLRRRLSQQSVADRTGASVNTIRRMEAGEPQIPLHFLVRVLHLFGELRRLEELLDSSKDEIGLALADESLPERIFKKKKPGKFAF